MSEFYAVVGPERDEPHLLDMELHVAYFDPYWAMAYMLSGDTPPQFFEVTPATPRLQAGEVVRMQGTARPATLPKLTEVRLTRVAAGRPFNAIVIEDNLLPMIMRREPALVRVDALVERQILHDETHLYLDLAMDRVRIRGVVLLAPSAPVPEFTGHLLSAEGILVPESDTNAPHPALLYVPDVSAIRSEGPAAESPRFSELPVLPIADLARHALQIQVGPSAPIPWVHLDGSILTIDSARELTLGDSTGRVRIITSATAGLTKGQRIEICGIPVLTRRGWRLERPIIRPSRLVGSGAGTDTHDVDPIQAVPATELRAEEQPIAPEHLPLLRTIQDYWNVPPERQDWLHQIDLELKVAYCDPGWGVMWAESGGAISYVDPKHKDADFSTGEVVRITGLVRPKPGAFTIHPELNIEPLAPYVPFEAVSVDGTLADPSNANRMVRVTGLVEGQTDEGPYHTSLAMVIDGYSVTVRYRHNETERLGNYVGKIVTLEGLFLPNGSATESEFSGVIWVGRLSTIEPQVALDRDPRFNIAPTFIEDLAQSPANQPVRLVGTVRQVAAGKSVTIEDPTDRITIRTSQKLPALVNTRVEVWGYPVSDGLVTSLLRPLFRVMTAADENQGTPRSRRWMYRNAQDILSLDSAEADRAHSVRLQGVVTWSSVHADSFYIRDASAGIEIRRPRDQQPGLPAPGTVVQVVGVTANDGATRVVDATSIQAAAQLPLEDPTLTTAEQAWTGSQDAQRIKLAGYVSRVRHEIVGGAPRWTVLELVAPGGQPFEARLPHVPGADQLRGAVVRVTGVCEVQADAGTDQVTGVTLHVNFLSDIEQVEPAQANPFDRDIQRIRELRSFGGLRKGIGLARIRGHVLAFLPGNGLILHEGDREGDQGLHVFLSDGPHPLLGDTVDVVGLVGHHERRVALREARTRVIARAVPTTPVRINSLDTQPLLDCRLVTVRALLLDTFPDDSRLVLRMSRDGAPFQASLAAANTDPGLAATLLPGASLDLTGVYRVDPPAPEHAGQFHLLLRTPADIVLIRRPSWFTAERARMLAAGLAGIIAVTFSWVYFLRRRVQHQTGQIRRQLIKEARLEDRQRNIIEKASDFIFMIDLAGGFTLFNPAGEAITGYARNDIASLTIFDLLAEPDRIRLRDGLLRAKPGGEIHPFQTQFRRKDRSTVWVEVAARFLSEEDRVTGALCVARDITERKRVEEELKRARDAAEANTRAKSAFLANMSHEIRTPMNGVIGMSNLLLDTHLSHEQRDFALTIRNSAEALLTVLNDILDFSKIEAGKLLFETLDFDLTETVDDTLDLLAARAASKHIELAALVPTTLPHKLRGDPGRLRQVLLNLVGNAIKFTERGEVSVKVALESESPRAVVLRFEVSDTGIGIDPAEQENLFVPFNQADASTTRKYGGTGLGLAISRQIVEQMNGRIGVRSQPGKGSTFWFVVELARGSESPLEPPPEKLRGQRVIGVDDNAINRSVLQHYLEPAGVRLDLASTAQEAVGMMRAASAAGDPFQLALIDYHMPGIDGTGLARMIGEDERLRGMPIALLTSVDRRFTAHELRELGISAAMTKPIRQRELMQTIQRAFSAEPPMATPIHTPESTSAAMPPLRVLIAEDNPVNQRLTRIQLKKLGYEADLACNGLEVLEAFERVSYDVIFMDCQMPELDGYDTARRLATHPRRSDVRIIAMTANAMQGDRDKCIESGMDDYLSKPTRPDDLAAALRRAAEAIARTV